MNKEQVEAAVKKVISEEREELKNAVEDVIRKELKPLHVERESEKGLFRLLGKAHNFILTWWKNLNTYFAIATFLFALFAAGGTAYQVFLSEPTTTQYMHVGYEYRPLPDPTMTPFYVIHSRYAESGEVNIEAGLYTSLSNIMLGQGADRHIVIFGERAHLQQLQP